MLAVVGIEPTNTKFIDLVIYSLIHWDISSSANSIMIQIIVQMKTLKLKVKKIRKKKSIPMRYLIQSKSRPFEGFP